jgi:thiamine biosynthesis lipoprotein
VGFARTLFVLAAFVVFVIGCTAPRAAEHRFEVSRLLMGVETRIVLFAPDEPRALAAAGAAFDEIARHEQILSDWRADSELSQLSQRAGSGPVPVSPELYDLLAQARRVAAATDGAFDPTVGPLVALWRTSRGTGRLPAPEELARARVLVGWRHLELDESARTVALAIPSMRLDLGGIAKGDACQRALEVLARAGIERTLVQMGGDLACGAPPPGRDGWDIDVAGQRVLVARTSVATSGDAEQHVVIDGVRYGHVVDPRTGLGATSLRQVTIAAADGAVADALSTAVSLLDAQSGRELARAFGARVLAP